ncbi:MAG: hypothetical protein DCC75_10660 [Proteobacteria bacterium]|nr:MAG: hypothetical protein DCC75_10660 [Pseudomonadota bacterium]
MVRKIAALIIISLSIAGCGSLIFSKGPGKMILVLGDGVRGCPDKETLTGSPLAIIAVRDRTSSPLINSSKILTSAAKGQRGYYHYSFWSEPPPARLLKLVADKLE